MPSKTANTMDLTSNKSPIQHAKTCHLNVSIFINSSIVWFKESKKIGIKSKTSNE